jgi:CheY-like chemotaxis protein
MVFLSLLTVTAVESAKHVLEVLRAGGPAVDVILLEVEFPHGRGLKLLKHIMREEKLKQIPVVSKYASADGLCVMFAPVGKLYKCTSLPIL